jgi:hypothetical protein
MIRQGNTVKMDRWVSGAYGTVQFFFTRATAASSASAFANASGHPHFPRLYVMMAEPVMIHKT